MSLGKRMLLLVGWLAFAAPAAFGHCYRFNSGAATIKVGHFGPKTFVADGFCVTGNYGKQGTSTGLQFTLKNKQKVLARYQATSERYTPVDVRFTLLNGEPEPQQFDAKWGAGQLFRIGMNGTWYELTTVW